MRRWNLSHFAISSCVTAALLAGCGASQPPIGAPGAMPQSLAVVPARTVAHRVRRATSSYQLLYRFRGRRAPDGGRPYAGLVKVNGTLYGTTSQGGLHDHGTVYSISTTGYGGSGCGSYGCGTVYTLSPSGTEKVLYSFKGDADGSHPRASLIGVSGALYGTTEFGGGGPCSGVSGCGTVYSVTTTGTETVLHSFGGPGDGMFPVAGLTNVNGTLFGTTGGTSMGLCHEAMCGTVFTLTP